MCFHQGSTHWHCLDPQVQGNGTACFVEPLTGGRYDAQDRVVRLHPSHMSPPNNPSPAALSCGIVHTQP